MCRGYYVSKHLHLGHFLTSVTIENTNCDLFLGISGYEIVANNVTASSLYLVACSVSP